MPDNKAQITLIERMAKRFGVTSEALSPHWVDLYSPKFRELWESGERDIVEMEKIIYARNPLGSNYADMVAAILIGQPDNRLTP